MAPNLTKRLFHRARPLALVALLSALAMPIAADAKPKVINRGMQSEHQPVVSYASYAYDISVGGNGELTGAEASRLEGWLASINLAYGDHVAIATQAGYYGAAIHDGVANVVARHGMLIEEDDTAPATPVPQGAVRLIVRRAMASVPGCPDWHQTAENNGMGGVSSNFGCGVNSNIAAMVANPEDLVRGQTSQSALRTAQSNRAIQTYRDKTPTGSGDLKAITPGGSN